MTEVRRDREEEYKQISVTLPKELVEEIDKFLIGLTPHIYHNRSHFVTCAILKMIREDESGNLENIK